MRNRRRVFAGLGVLAFLAAVILTQMSADESRWSNFGISVGLSIGLAVFMWFITDGLRADIKKVLGNQDELADHVDKLMKTIGEGTEGTEGTGGIEQLSCNTDDISTSSISWSSVTINSNINSNYNLITITITITNTNTNTNINKNS